MKSRIYFCMAAVVIILKTIKSISNLFTLPVLPQSNSKRFYPFSFPMNWNFQLFSSLLLSQSLKNSLMLFWDFNNKKILSKTFLEKSQIFGVHEINLPLHRSPGGSKKLTMGRVTFYVKLSHTAIFVFVWQQLLPHYCL